MHQLLRQARRRHQARDEQGIALIVAMTILMVSVIVVAAVLQLASHTAQQSGFGRNRTAAVNAAEAGIQSELATLGSGACPTGGIATETTLPNQTAPSASYVVLTPPSCTSNGSTAVIAATGYVPNATHPVYSTTMVAHVNRNQGAPVSGGAAGGYDFPDAVFTDGALTSTSGTLNLYGSGGDVPNLTADGAITIGSSSVTGSLLGGAVSGESSVNVYASQIGGSVAGTSVTLKGAAAGNGLTVQGSVGAQSSLSTSNVTINGTTTSSGATLPQSRPLGTFTNNASDIGTTLGVGTSATTLCPASATAWTAAFYDITASCTAGYAPTSFSTTASNGDQVIVVQGSFTVTVPPTAVGGALYIVDAGGTGDSLTISDSGSTLPVFAFTDGSMSVTGTVAGQLAAHSITFTGQTNLTFRPPATPMPDIAFPTGYFAPTLTGSNAFVSTVSYEYQCPGTTAC